MSRDVGHRLGSRQDDCAGHADFEIHGVTIGKKGVGL